MNEKQKEQSQTSSRSAFIVILLAGLAIFGVSAIFVSRSVPVISTTAVEYAPVARVGGTFLPFSSYRRRVERNIRLWKGSLSDEELVVHAERSALEELVREQVVRELLSEYGMSVSDEMVEAEYERMGSLVGGQDILRAEYETYNWDDSIYVNEVVKSLSELNALQSSFLRVLPEGNQVADDQAHEQALSARERVLGGESFDAVALNLEDEGVVRIGGGGFGWTSEKMLDLWFREALVGAESGIISDPIRSPIGYHVVYVEDVRGEDGDRQLMLSEMLFFVPDVFTPWLESRIANAEVSVFLPGMYWDRGTIVSE